MLRAIDGSRSCWGGEVKGDLSACDSTFLRAYGSRKAKTVLRDKFCRSCKRFGIVVHASRVGALTPAMERIFKNSRSGGVWTTDSKGRCFRLVNNNLRDCTKPVLVILQKPCESGSQKNALTDPDGCVHLCETVPDEWLSGERADEVIFTIANNTLTPQRKSQLTPMQRELCNKAGTGTEDRLAQPERTSSSTSEWLPGTAFAPSLASAFSVPSHLTRAPIRPVPIDPRAMWRPPAEIVPAVPVDIRHVHVAEHRATYPQCHSCTNGPIPNALAHSRGNSNKSNGKLQSSHAFHRMIQHVPESTDAAHSASYQMSAANQT